MDLPEIDNISGCFPRAFLHLIVDQQLPASLISLFYMAANAQKRLLMRRFYVETGSGNKEGCNNGDYFKGGKDV